MPSIAFASLAQLDDSGLLNLISNGDAAALETMIDRYRGFTRFKARAYFLPGADTDDLVQEGMIGLFKAIRDYDTAKGPFSCFAELCVTRQIHTAIKMANRLKHRPLSRAVSLDADPARSRGDSASMFENLPDTSADVADCVASADAVDRLRVDLTELLTNLEQEVLHLYIQGRSYTEIAEWLGRNLKSIDNALQRIRRKFDRHFNPTQDS